MDQKTREALERIIEEVRESDDFLYNPGLAADVKKIEKWINNNKA